jgi:hypothetical protein
MIDRQIIKRKTSLLITTLASRIHARSSVSLRMAQLSLQLNALVLQVSVLDLEVFDGALKELNWLAVLFLPLLSDLLLVDHHRVRLLLEGLISFFHFDHDWLQVRYLLISVILDLVESVMLVDFAFLALRNSLVFFISQLVGQVPQPLIFVK